MGLQWFARRGVGVRVGVHTILRTSDGRPGGLCDAQSCSAGPGANTEAGWGDSLWGCGFFWGAHSVSRVGAHGQVAANVGQNPLLTSRNAQDAECSKAGGGRQQQEGESPSTWRQVRPRRLLVASLFERLMALASAMHSRTHRCNSKNRCNKNFQKCLM